MHFKTAFINHLLYVVFLHIYIYIKGVGTDPFIVEKPCVITTHIQ